MTLATLTYAVGDERLKRTSEFADPQDALVFLWSEAEDVPEDARYLRATIDGLEVKL